MLGKKGHSFNSDFYKYSFTSLVKQAETSSRSLKSGTYDLRITDAIQQTQNGFTWFDPRRPNAVYRNMNMNYGNEHKEAKQVIWGICFESPRSVYRSNLKLFSFKGSISGRLQHRCLLGHEKADNQTEKAQD